MELVSEAFPAGVHVDSEAEDLSDEQIEQLLQQAETRLRQQVARKADSGRYVPVIPRAGKLDVSALPKPYVQTNGEIAQADTHRLLDEKHRRLADGGIRKVEDPVLVKKKALEVRYHLCLFIHTLLPMRKTFPIFFS